MKKVVLLFLSFFLSGLVGVYAQTRSLTGTVISSEDNSPIPGVSVLVKGTTLGTVTNLDGVYYLEVPLDAATLVFSFMGMRTVELPIVGTTINVTLDADIIGVDEIMVVAYGTARRSTFTGAAVQVNAQQIENRPISNVSKALEGLSTGIQVSAGSGQPGEGQAIRIRGFGSINASSAPLYVVDGVPYALGINNLNGADIESMTVLKDAAATALYGNRAANGVIMITTKKGTAMRARFDVNASIGFSNRAIPEYDRLDAAQWTELAWEAYRNQLHYTSGQEKGLASQNATNGLVSQINYNPWGVPNDAVVGTDGKLNPNASLVYLPGDLDWEDALTRIGNRKEFSMSYSGGQGNTNHFVSLSYLDDQGYLIKSNFERFTARINVNSELKKWFKTGLNISGNSVAAENARDGSSTGFVNPFFFSRSIGPIYPIYAQNMETGDFILDESGNKIFDLGGMGDIGLPARPGGAHSGRHVLAETLYNEDGFKRNTLSARTFGDITFLKDFVFTVNAAVDFNNYLENTFDNPLVGDGSPAGRGSRVNSRITAITFNQLLNYRKSIGDNNLHILLGHENYDWTYNYQRGFSQGLILEGNSELINFTTINASTSYTREYRTEGYFTSLNYDFDERYIFSASFRRDGSSRFYQDTRWGNFWSVGGAWRLDRESFLVNDVVNLLMLRMSYGQTGNDGLDSYYPWHALYSIRNNANEAGFLQLTLPAESLEWESNNAATVAIEFGLFNRIRGNVDLFHRVSDNLLFAVPLPISTGVLEEDRNIGTMYNQGFETRMAVDVLAETPVKWTVEFNATHIKNQISKMPGGPEDEIIDGTKKLMEGRSIYDFWLRQWWGVNPDDGMSLYYAENALLETDRFIIGGDTLTSNSANAMYEYSGTSIPKIFGSFTNNFSFGNFDLSVLLTYQLGGKVYDGTYATLMGYSTWGSSMHIDQANRWQNPGDVTDVPRMNPPEVARANAASNRWLTSASYLNVRSVNLSYTLPGSLVSKLDIERVRLFTASENLHYFSHRKGMNVQQNFAGTTTNVYAPARSVTFGINVSF